MATPSDGNGNPEETPNPSLKKRPRKRKNNLHNETSSEENINAPRDSTQEIHGQPSETLSPVALEARDSRTRSIGTTASAHHSTTESQTSGYSTESGYPTAFGYEPLGQSSSSFASLETIYGPPPTDFLREIHVEINPSSTEEEIQSVRRDLQELLTNAMFHIGRWNNQAIYIIAYNYM